MGAPCSLPSLIFHISVPRGDHSPDSWAVRLSSTQPASEPAPVWDKEGLKIKHCKYSCFLHVESASESFRTPRQPGPDSSFEGGGSRGRGCPHVPQFLAAV